MRGLLGHTTGVVIASLVAILTAGLLAPVAEPRRDLSPAMFQEVSTGVALIRTYGCGGRPIAEGTGFLVGSSVLMTARHVVNGACRLRILVNVAAAHHSLMMPDTLWGYFRSA